LLRGRIEFFLIIMALLSTALVFFLLAPFIALALSVDTGVLSDILYRDRVLASEAWSALSITFQAATISTTILLVLGVPLAYILAFYRFPGRQVVEALIDLPLVVPHAIAGVMVLVAYGRRGLFGSIPSSIGLCIEDCFWGIVAVMVFVSTPILVDTIKIGFKGVDESIIYTARSLGASKWRVFHTIVLPLSRENILAGALLSWARAVSEVGAILVIAYYPKSANVLVIEWLNIYGLKYSIALSIVVLVVSLTVFTILRILVRK